MVGIKIWRTRKYTLTLINQLLIYELHRLLWVVFFQAVFPL